MIYTLRTMVPKRYLVTPIKFLSLIASAIVIGVVSSHSEKDAVMLAVILVVVPLLWRYPYLSLGFLVIGTLLSGTTFHTSVGNLRIEQVAAAGCLLPMLKLAMRNRERPSKAAYGGRVTDRVTLGFACWVAINAFSSIFAPNPFKSEKMVLWLFLDLLGFIYVRMFIREYGIKTVYWTVYALVNAELLYGVIYHVLSGVHTRALGSMQEPDLFGAMAAAMIPLSIASFSRSLAGRRNFVVWRVIVILLEVSALIVSDTRSSLVALIITIPLMAYRRTELGSITRRLLPVALIGALVSGAYLLGSAGRARFNVNHTATLSFRLVRVRMALSEFGTSAKTIWIGHGTDAYGQTHSYLLYGKYFPDYLPVQSVELLYDTGIAGVAIFVLFVVWLFKDGRKASSRGRNPVAWGATFSLLILFISYQATTGIWFVLTWILVAISVHSSRRVGVSGAVPYD